MKIYSSQKRYCQEVILFRFILWHIALRLQLFLLTTQGLNIYLFEQVHIILAPQGGVNNPT